MAIETYGGGLCRAAGWLNTATAECRAHGVARAVGISASETRLELLEPIGNAELEAFAQLVGESGEVSITWEDVSHVRIRTFGPDGVPAARRVWFTCWVVPRGAVSLQAPDLLQLLGARLLFQTQVAADSPYTLVSGSELLELKDWTGQGADLLPNLGNGDLQYVPSGAPQNLAGPQPYALQAGVMLFNDFLEGAIATIPAGGRVEYYCVARCGASGLGIPMQIITPNPGTRTIFYLAGDVTDVTMYGQSQPGALQDVLAGPTNAWALWSTGYLASGMDGRLNHVPCVPNFVGADPTSAAPSCEYSAIYSPQDALAFCAGVDVSADPATVASCRAVMRYYTNYFWGF